MTEVSSRVVWLFRILNSIYIFRDRHVSLENIEVLHIKKFALVEKTSFVI